jgi:hypothetical protein
MLAPKGFVWEGVWKADVWMYALDYPATMAPYQEKKRTTDCVRRRVWSRPITIEAKVVGTLGSDGGGAIHRFSTTPGAVGARTFDVTAAFSGPISSRWTTSSGAPFSAPGGGNLVFPGGWATVDAESGQLFLLETKSSLQALRTVDLKDVAGVKDLHPLQVGAEHAVQLDLDGKANSNEKGAAIQLVGCDFATCALASNAIRAGSVAARALTATDVKDGIVSGGKMAAAIAARSMAQGFGWVLGGRAGHRVANKMGL